MIVFLAVPAKAGVRSGTMPPDVLTRRRGGASTWLWTSGEARHDAS
jgi:hypothetical protein